jgi:hypothetical protein
VEALLPRLLVVVAVAAAAVAVGRLSARRGLPSHPPITIDGLGLPPGIVVFTSTECDNCKRVMALVAEVDAPVREVTRELEASVVAEAGVEAVPLLVVTEPDGTVVAQLAGVPSRRAVRRAVARAGW